MELKCSDISISDKPPTCLNKITLAEAWYGVKPSILQNVFRVFGCVAYLYMYISNSLERSLMAKAGNVTWWVMHQMFIACGR